MNFLVYDIETLRNAAVFCFYNVQNQQKKSFRIFNTQTAEELVTWMKTKTKDFYHVGYNNIGFDGQVIAAIVKKPKMDAFDIYEEAQRVIELKDDSTEKEKVFKSVPEWKMPFKQIDLYKIKNYDSNAKRTSLKWLEFVFKQKNVMEMPINHYETVTQEELDVIEEYCWNDVETTYKAFKFFWEDIRCRFELSQEFGINLDNCSEPKLVKKIYVSELSKKLGLSKDELKRRCDEFKKTKKPFLPRIIDWLQFDDPRFEQTKKQFANTYVNPDNIKGALSLSYKWRNLVLNHGLGGLHACCNPGTYTNENLFILDIDFTSYYPFIKIRNGMFPPYLGSHYLEIYEGFYHKRKLYAKGTSLNFGFKTMLNGSFGLMLEPNSPIYNPEGAIFVTVNGQLILLYMLQELVRAAPETFIVQCNTDGVTIMFEKENLEKIREVIKTIEEKTRIQIETVDYQKMIIRDVNSYIAIDTKGKTKLKGAFEIDKEPYKNHSFTIVPMALEHYFVRGGNYQEFIRNTVEIWPFLGAAKKKRNFDLDYNSIVDGNPVCEKQQRVTRYFVSKKGGALSKNFGKKSGDSKRSGATRLESGYVVQIANIIESELAADYNLNYDYYISETKKIIAAVEKNKTQLSLF
jgi:hypothetical protein